MKAAIKELANVNRLGRRTHQHVCDKAGARPPIKCSFTAATGGEFGRAVRMRVGPRLCLTREFGQIAQ